MRIGRTQLIVGTFLWWLSFLGLRQIHAVPEVVLNTIGFSFLLIVPGMLTMRSLRLVLLQPWAKLTLSVALSLLELMLVGLSTNTALQWFGASRPLDPPFLIGAISVLLLGLSAVTWLRSKDWQCNLRIWRRIIFPTQLDACLSLLPLVFVGLSVLGATSLNNGGPAIWTMIMLLSMGVYTAVLLYFGNRLGMNTVPMALFFMGLSLLLMTSLRGWYITGHDVQREYRVFQLAKDNGLWQISYFRDPYNACLSITILPTIFANLLRTFDPYIYKLFFQIIFALSPTVVYMISRRWVSQRLAALAGLYFIAFPTFFSDMSSLVRQEVAFLFFGLMLYVVFAATMSTRMRRGLFMALGVGVILSHYSTTYTVLFTFALCAVSYPIAKRLLRWCGKRGWFKESALDAAHATLPKAKIGLGMVLILGAVSFIWTAALTHTGKGVTHVVQETTSAMRGNFGQDSRSSDATSLVGANTQTPQQKLNAYVKTIVDPIRKDAPPGYYYPQQTYDPSTIKGLSDEHLPYNHVGQAIKNHGFDIGVKLPLFGQLLSKALEVLAPIGFLYVLLRRTYIRQLDVELYVLAFFSLIFLLLNIVLPSLSTEYGIFRALQQSLFVIAFLLVVGSVALGNIAASITIWLGTHVLRIRRSALFPFEVGFVKVFPSALLVIFLLYSTAFIPQLFGGNVAVMHLANTGRYSDNYLIRAPEAQGIDWLAGVVNSHPDISENIQAEVQTDRYSRIKSNSIASLDAYNDIYPGLVRRNSYVFLGYSDVRKQRATLLYNGDQLSYQYPLWFLDQHKDLIYDTGSSRTYH